MKQIISTPRLLAAVVLIALGAAMAYNIQVQNQAREQLRRSGNNTGSQVTPAIDGQQNKRKETLIFLPHPQPSPPASDESTKPADIKQEYCYYNHKQTIDPKICGGIECPDSVCGGCNGQDPYQSQRLICLNTE